MQSWVESLDAGTFHGTRAMDAAAAAPLELAIALAELAGELYAADTIDQVLERVLRACTAMVEGCAHAGISVLGARGRIETPAWTDEIALQLDELQYELGEGPCVQAIREERSFAVPDLAADPRFPVYGPRAAARGAGSMLACRLFTDERTIAALNLYGVEPHAFTEADGDIAALLAAHAAVAIDTARNRANLQEAVQTRQVIGEAVGILRERYGITSDEAFRRLTEASQHLNVKLREIARHLSTTTDSHAADSHAAGGRARSESV